MRNLIATLCLTVAVLLGSAGMSWSADFQKGFDAYLSGDFATALREWEPLAEQGDADAQYTLGVMYDNGDGVPQNYKTALKWYTLAAEQGYARAQRQVEKLQEKIDREEQSASNPGFRDLRPGLHKSTISDLKVCKSSLRSWTICYDLQNLKFRGTFDGSSFLEKLTVDLGPIVQMGGFIDQLSTYVTQGETNIFLKMRNTLGEKYNMDFEFSERDRQLFNEDQKDNLYTVYNGGQVALLINRKEREYDDDLWLYIEYRDVKPAQIFLESTKPFRAESSDF